MEKGILTNEQEKYLAGLVDNALKLSGVLELFDGYAAKVLITMLDDKVVDKLKESVKVKLAELVAALLGNNLELAETLAADTINGLVDIPGLDEESEGLIFRGTIEILVGVVIKKVEEIKQAPVTLQLKK